MKQIVAFLLAAMLCVSLFAACGKQTEEVPETTPPDKEESIPNRAEDDLEKDKNNIKDDAESIMDEMNPNKDGNQLKAGVSLEDIVMKLGEKLGITMPTNLDDATLRDVFGIQPDWLEDYYGEYSAANTSADHLLAFKVKEDHKKEVKEALEQRREAMIQSFEEGLLEQLEKARNATIVEKGNYLFFIIAGDVQNGADKEVNRAKEIIDSYFE